MFCLCRMKSFVSWFLPKSPVVAFHHLVAFVVPGMGPNQHVDLLFAKTCKSFTYLVNHTSQNSRYGTAEVYLLKRFVYLCITWPHDSLIRPESNQIAFSIAARHFVGYFLVSVAKFPLSVLQLFVLQCNEDLLALLKRLFQYILYN